MRPIVQLTCATVIGFLSFLLESILLGSSDLQICESDIAVYNTADLLVFDLNIQDSTRYVE